MRSKSFPAFALAISACVTGQARAAYTVSGAVVVPYTTTDDTLMANPITYTSVLIQNNQQVTNPNGNAESANSPYIVGTMGLTTGTSAFGSSTTTTAFYYNSTVGLHFFGQYDPNTTAQYLNSGSTYSYNTPNGAVLPLNYHDAAVAGVNSSGVVAAYDGIQAPDSKSNDVLGRHAYLFNPSTGVYTPVGLIGGLTGPSTSGASYSVNYIYTNTATSGSTTSTGVYNSSSSVGIDSLGNASGTSSRLYAFGGVARSSLASLGTSEWFYNATTKTTNEAFITSPGYSYRITESDGGNGTYASYSDRGTRNGFTVGLVNLYLDTGDSASHQEGLEDFVYNSVANTTTPLSLYLSGKTPTVDGSTLPYAYSYPVTVNSTAGVPFTANYRSSNFGALNSAGQVGGVSNLYSGTTPKGQDAWVYTPPAVGVTTGNYQQVGLISNGFAAGGTTSFVSTTGQRNSTINFLNAAGTSVGTSTQYVSSVGGGTGNITTTNAAWYARAGGTSVQIGLTDAIHTETPTGQGYTLSNNFVTQLTEGGLVAGTASRYVPGDSSSMIGTDAWVYDPNGNGGLGVTYVLDPNPSATTFFTSSVTYISETGYVVGQYKTVNISAAPFSAFEWSVATGFVDLTTNLSPDISTTPFQTLTQGFSIDPTGTTIYAFGAKLNNGIAAQNGVAVLTAVVPEPASVTAAVGLFAVTLLRRRRVAEIAR